MLKYVLKRIGLMLITAVIIIFLVFVFIKQMPEYYPFVPGDDPQVIVDKKIRDGVLYPDGTEVPVVIQFFNWSKKAITKGDFGWSDLKNQPSGEFLGERIPITVKVNIIPYLISIPIGIGLGIWAALKKNKITDHVISTGVMVMISIPTFVTASLLQYYLGYVWKIFPPKMAAGIDIAANPALAMTSIMIPIIAMTLGTVASLSRVTRAELSEVLTSEFILLCRTKGLNKRQATYRHALRNSLVPLAPSLIGGFVSILSGSTVLEKIFEINGIGGAYLEAFNGNDYNLIMVIMAFYTVIGLATTLIVDLSYGFIDPRIRMGAGKNA